MKALAMFAGISALVLAQGCSNTVATTSQEHYEPMGTGWKLPQSMPHIHSHKTIDDYAEQLAMQLIENLHYAKPEDTVAVTSFVELDSSLMKTNLIGNHLADSLMGELQQFGVAVLDYKLRDAIVVNADGDFAFSRDHTRLQEWHDIDYILSGTMTRNARGILIHARIAGMKSKVVVSSAKILLPNHVINSIYYSNTLDGIHYGS